MNPTLMLQRLPKGEDLLESLLKCAVRLDVEYGAVTVIGALERAVLGFYSQDAQEYGSFAIEEPVEILSGLGNISYKDGRPFVHLHLVLGRKDGSCIGGHAMPGALIFAAEAQFQPALGKPRHRSFDQATGLYLWPED